jgi:hypothetical protein
MDSHPTGASPRRGDEAEAQQRLEFKDSRPLQTSEEIPAIEDFAALGVEFDLEIFLPFLRRQRIHFWPG